MGLRLKCDIKFNKLPLSFNKVLKIVYINEDIITVVVVVVISTHTMRSKIFYRCYVVMSLFRILQLLNRRVLEDLKTFWWEYNRTECEKIEDESDGISIYNIGGVFLVIFIGIGLGLITLAFEYYWYRIRPGSRNKDGKPGTDSGDLKQNGVAGQTGIDNQAFDH